MGAFQNRLQSTLASIQNTTENLSAAESRIRDVDVAWETADLTRNTILQQAATSVLAQANLQPQLALSLLN
jgi:flagellin